MQKNEIIKSKINCYLERIEQLKEQIQIAPKEREEHIKRTNTKAIEQYKNDIIKLINEL